MGIVALTGRPNVGKSSLFNRLIGKRKALVWNQEGVTRDLHKSKWMSPHDHEHEIWDMAGWGKWGLSLQTIDKDRLKKIDLFVVVVDGSEPLTAADRECLDLLRKTGKRYAVALNKADKKSFQEFSHEIFEIAPDAQSIYPISAETGFGILELEEFIEQSLPSTAHQKAAHQSRDVLILGRPNVGKSSLLNQIAGEAISLVSDIPGTTRDSMSYEFERGTKHWTIHDTAGIRKKSKIYGKKADPIEIFSAMKAIKELEKADFAILVIETHPRAELHSQDRKLLNLIRQSLIPTVLVVNKWDLVRADWKEDAYRDELKFQLGDLNFLPILFVSAKTGFHVPKIFQVLSEMDRRRQKLSTSRLNKWLEKTLERKPPRVAKKGVTAPGKRTPTQYIHFNYIVQTGTDPMSFQIFCNAPHAIAEDDKRYLEKSLRQEFALTGIPLKFVFRKKSTKEQAGFLRA